MDAKKLMLDSIYQLLQDHAFENISVQMILDHSGVSRATFYRYYQDKYDLMNSYYQIHIDKLLDRIGKEIKWSDGLAEIMIFLDKNKNYYKKAIKVEGPNSFLSFLYQYSFDFYENAYLKHMGIECLDTEALVSIEMLCSGHVSAVIKWLERGCHVPSKQMAEILYVFIPEKIRSIL